VVCKIAKTACTAYTSHFFVILAMQKVPKTYLFSPNNSESSVLGGVKSSKNGRFDAYRLQQRKFIRRKQEFLYLFVLLEW